MRAGRRGTIRSMQPSPWAHFMAVVGWGTLSWTRRRSRLRRARSYAASASAAHSEIPKPAARANCWCAGRPDGEYRNCVEHFGTKPELIIVLVDCIDVVVGFQAIGKLKVCVLSVH